MTRTPHPRWVGLLLGLSVTIGAFSFVLQLIPLRSGVPSDNVSVPEAAAAIAFIYGTPSLGAMLALKRPENPIGWLFLALGLSFSSQFAIDALVRHVAPSPLLGALASIAENAASFGLALLFLALMLFPTGDLPSRRWRILPVVLIAASFMGAIAGILTPGSPVTPPIGDLPNPLAVPSWRPFVDAVNELAIVGYASVAVATVVLLVVRFRRARGTEREQIKWFAWGGGVPALLFIAMVAYQAAVGVGSIGSSPAIGDLIWALFISSLVLVPIAAAIAILRYRLYDIDRIISRTVSYAVLTAILAAVYGAGFLVLQAALAPFTSGGGPVAVAASTLVVFGLFSPVRRRIQALVDRRFNRSRYDAEREVDSFAAHVRDEVDVERVTGALATTLARTMQPAAAVVWLRSGEAGR